MITDHGKIKTNPVFRSQSTHQPVSNGNYLEKNREIKIISLNFSIKKPQLHPFSNTIVLLDLFLQKELRTLDAVARGVREIQATERFPSLLENSVTNSLMILQLGKDNLAGYERGLQNHNWHKEHG